MILIRHSHVWLVLALCAASLGGAQARSQAPSPPPPSYGPPPGPPPGGPGGPPWLAHPPHSSTDAERTVSSMRGGLQLGPPGRWWDDSTFAKDLGLRPDQQRRMDEIFDAARAGLFQRFYQLRIEQDRLEALTRQQALDQAALMNAIDRVTVARGEVEKANTRMLIQIRAQMTPEQIQRLENHRHRP